MKKSYKWKVCPEPTGQYACFSKRHWPSATYKNGDHCASISCSQEYCPRKVKEGNHPPLILFIADYSKPNDKCPWTRQSMRKTYNSLKEAKQALDNVFKTYPEMMQK